MSKRYCYTSIILSALFCATPSLADKPQPRFSANGYASDYAVGEMDLMIPLSGDQLRHTYFSPAIAYGSDNQGYADLGLGHRWIQNNKTLLGVYLFVVIPLRTPRPFMGCESRPRGHGSTLGCSPQWLSLDGR